MNDLLLRICNVNDEDSTFPNNHRQQLIYHPTASFGLQKIIIEYLLEMMIQCYKEATYSGTGTIFEVLGED